MCLGVGRNHRNLRHQFRPTGVQKRTEQHTSETPRFGSFGAREVSKNTPKITHRIPFVSAVWLCTSMGVTICSDELECNLLECAPPSSSPGQPGAFRQSAPSMQSRHSPRACFVMQSAPSMQSWHELSRTCLAEWVNARRRLSHRWSCDHLPVIDFL